MKKLLIVLLSIILSVLGFIALPWIILGVGLYMLPGPPKPAIQYGEFPFHFECEINKQRKVVNDTLICKYKGVGINEGKGKYREWTAHLTSGNEYIKVMEFNGKEVRFLPGNAEYYMGDSSSDFTYGSVSPSLEIDAKNGSHSITPEELAKEYHIKIIHWNCPKPLTNKF